MNSNALASLSKLHHAYLIVGGSLEDVSDVLAKRGVTVAGNPDVYSQSASELSVDIAREIAQFASLKALSDNKYIIVAFSRATAEAQNALLKVVEEAPGDSVFFFCVESVGHVLPTLRSRCVVVESERRKVKGESEEAEEFLKAGYEKRLAAVEKMTGYISKTQDRVPVREFVRGLLIAARGGGLPAPSLRDLLDADRYLRMQGSSAKAVLSHLAVTLPKSR